MEQRNRLFLIHLWLISLLLSYLTFNKYYVKVMGKGYGLSEELALIFYILFFVIVILSIRKIQYNFNSRLHSIFILGIFVFNWISSSFLELPRSNYVYQQSLNYIPLFIISVLGLSFIKNKLINEILKRYYLLAFIVGILFMVLTKAEIIERNVLLNENSWGFFLAPYLMYLMVKQKAFLQKILVYFIALVLIYLSDAKTTFVTFMAAPLFIYVFNIVKKPRMLYAIMILTALFLIYSLSFINSEILTSLLSKRNLLWNFYLENFLTGVENLYWGIGRWTIIEKGIPNLHGLGAHNTFVSLLHFNGIIVLILYILFIIFGMRRKSTTFTVSDGILYLVITFQFAESNIPLFSFYFPAFIFMANMLINKESEEAEKRLET